MNKYDFNCCRVCLSYNNLSSIFSMDGDKKISEKVTFCASIQIRENDGLPPNICEQCKSYLNRAFVFKTVCEVTNEKLLQLLADRQLKETKQADQDDHFEHVREEIKTCELSSNVEDLNEIVPDMKTDASLDEFLILKKADKPQTVATFSRSSPDHFVCGDDIFVDKVTNIDVNEVLVYSDFFVESPVDPLESAHVKTNKVGRHIAKKNAGQHPRKLHRTEDVDVTETKPGKTASSRRKCIETKRLRLKRKKKMMKNDIDVKESSVKFTCEVCEKGFPYRSHLLRHLNTHTGLKRHACGYCDKAFVNSYNLSEHLRKHTGDFPLKCDVCDKGFSSPSILKRHVRSHTGELPYQCKYCRKKFGHSSSRKLHEKMHLHRPVYKCDVCHKGFSYTNSLLAHRKTHANFKPHSCSLCKKSFTRRLSLVRHMRLHVRDATDVDVKLAKLTKRKETFKCANCGKKFYTKLLLTKHCQIHSSDG